MKLIKRLLLVAIAIGFTSLGFDSRPVNAHVLIRDEANSVGAILHITPDDDPIAGEESSIYFNLKGRPLGNSDVSISITNVSTGLTETAKVTMTNSGVETHYIFSSRGVYEIKLKVSGERGYSFAHTQRVSRGIGTDSAISPSYPLATLGLVLSGVALAFVGLTYTNRKKDIDKQSKF